MQVSVVFNDAGDIITAMHAANGHSQVGLRAGPGQHHKMLDMPERYTKKAFSDVAHLLRVNTKESRLEDKQIAR